MDPALRSLAVALAALALVAPPAIGLAYAGARKAYRGRSMVEALVLVPLILPPSVVGYLLVRLLGPHGVLGAILAHAGVILMFSPSGAVLAAAVVALPLVERTAGAAFAAVDPEYERVARTLGKRPFEVFRRITLPLAWRGLLAALVLGFARAIGEFGATLMFAGNIPGRTTTLPLALYDAYLTGDEHTALVLTAALVGLSLAIVFLAGSLARSRT